MQRDSYAFLETLMSAPSPSGFEEPAQSVVYDRMKKFCQRVDTDVHGNVIGVLNGDAKLRVMLAGHVDQIGLMVKHVTKEGYVRFDDIGGTDVATLPTKRVIIHGKKGPVRGVVGRKAVHLMEKEEHGKVQKIDKLWIDIGVSSKREAEERVAVGDPVTFDAAMVRLAGDVVASAGFDDKVGSFVVAETLRLLSKRKLKIAVYGVSTVQEELGLRGARTSTFGIDPHAGIAVDVNHATDYPDASKAVGGEVHLGKGPTVSRGGNINCVLGDMIVAAAKKRRIPFQMTGHPGATGTDANAIQISRRGVAAALLGIPNRYMHTTVEMVSLKDLENCARLLAAALSTMPAEVDFRPLAAHRRRRK
ncbi:MAG: hydrolase [Planctomycetes bacterium SM23_65]|nr:MAG: hydrolase [Planctomycetes bacterium SM23_65]